MFLVSKYFFSMRLAAFSTPFSFCNFSAISWARCLVSPLFTSLICLSNVSAVNSLREINVLGPTPNVAALHAQNGWNEMSYMEDRERYFRKQIYQYRISVDGTTCIADIYLDSIFLYCPINPTWSIRTLKITVGIPARKLAAVVPAPPWWTAIKHLGNNHSWGASYPTEEEEEMISLYEIDFVLGIEVWVLG